MKQLLLVLIGIFISTVASSQNKATELYISGNSNFKSGKFQEAISNYTELMKMVDDKTVQKTCYINRGLSYDRIKKFDLAISDFTEAIKLDSSDMASFIDRGLSKMHAGYLEKAKEDYKSIELKPNYVESIANRGTAKINLLTGNGNLQPKLKQTRSACKDLKKAKELGDSAVDDLIYVYCDRKEKKKRN